MVSKTAKRATRKTVGKKKTSKTSRVPTRREEFSAGKAMNGTAGKAPTVHCMLAPLEDDSLLLPTHVIAEVVEFKQPDPITATPDWFLGQIEWDNRQVPVFSYSALIKGAEPAPIANRSRIMIVKSLSDSARVPYLGFLIKDIPRLVTVLPDNLTNTGDENKSMGVFCHVEIEGQVAVIPDLERLTHLITHVAYGALPITQVNN